MTGYSYTCLQKSEKQHVCGYSLCTSLWCSLPSILLQFIQLRPYFYLRPSGTAILFLTKSTCICLFRVSGRALSFGFSLVFESGRVTLSWKTHATYNLLYFLSLVPRSGPRNVRVFDETTNSLSVQWDHADGPVQQYRIIYSPTVGDPIDEYVSSVIP